MYGQGYRNKADRKSNSRFVVSEKISPDTGRKREISFFFIIVPPYRKLFYIKTPWRLYNIIVVARYRTKIFLYKQKKVPTDLFARCTLKIYNCLFPTNNTFLLYMRAVFCQYFFSFSDMYKYNAFSTNFHSFALSFKNLPKCMNFFSLF